MIQRLFIFLTLFTHGYFVSAQMQIQLALEYDLENQSVVVKAKPNFTQSDFTWGPSQISLVIPASKGTEKFPVQSVNAGLWSDNSLIISPEKNEKFSFHGFGTNGAKVDLFQGEETELFRLRIEDMEKLKMVRLFEIGLDPESHEKGMMGSDFRHSIVGLNGQELYSGNFEDFTEKFLTAEPSEELSVFPNPNSGEFYLKLPEKLKGGDLKLTYFDTNGSVLFEEAGSAESIENTQRVLPKNLSDQLILIKAFNSENSNYFSKTLLKK